MTNETNKFFYKNDLLTYLEENNIPFKLIEHEPIFTVEQGKEFKSKFSGSHTKNLFLKDKKNNFFLLTMISHKSADLGKLEKEITNSRLSFASEKYLDEILGIKPGSVSSFALINDHERKIKFIIDKNLTSHDPIWLHPLLNDASIGVNYADLVKFLQLINADYIVKEIAYK